jgi:hypothetical protein
MNSEAAVTVLLPAVHLEEPQDQRRGTFSLGVTVEVDYLPVLEDDGKSSRYRLVTDGADLLWLAHWLRHVVGLPHGSHLSVYFATERFTTHVRCRTLLSHKAELMFGDGKEATGTVQAETARPKCVRDPFGW